MRKCDDKYDGGAAPEKGCFAKLEAKDDGATLDRICPTTGDSAALEARVEAFVADVASELAGVP